MTDWPHTNSDRATYRARTAIPVIAPEAEPIKSTLRSLIHAADAVACLIAQGTSHDPWIDWELGAALDAQPRPGLIGILLHPHARHPPKLADCGAIFVPFRKDAIDRAIRWSRDEPHTRGDFTLQDE